MHKCIHLVILSCVNGHFYLFGICVLLWTLVCKYWIHCFFWGIYLKALFTFAGNLYILIQLQVTVQHPFTSIWKTPFSLSCGAGLVAIKSLSFLKNSLLGLSTPFFFSFLLGIVDLQYCDSFRCTFRFCLSGNLWIAPIIIIEILPLHNKLQGYNIVIHNF